MPAMSQTTTLLLWIHWIQFAAERVALLGSGLFAGAQLYRSLLPNQQHVPDRSQDRVLLLLLKLLHRESKETPTLVPPP